MSFAKILEDSAAPMILDRRGPRKILVGLLLSLLPVISFFPLGYVLAAFQARLEGRHPGELPDWAKPEELFVRGVAFFLVILTYAAIPFLFTSAAFSMLRMGFVYFPPAVVTLAISAALWLVVIFIMPMAMALFLKKRTIGAVFDLGEIYQLTSLVLTNYLRATLLNLVLLAVVSLPAVVSPAGLLLSSPLTFLVMVYMASVYGAISPPVLPGEPELPGQ